MKKTTITGAGGQAGGAGTNGRAGSLAVNAAAAAKAGKPAGAMAARAAAAEEPEAPRMTKDAIQKLLAEAQAMEAQQLPWVSIWQRVADVVNPARGSVSFPSQNGTPDLGKVAENFDSTAMRANRTLAQGQASRITPMGARWFVLRPPYQLQDTPAAVDWYLRCSEVLNARLYDSNFYKIAYQHYLDRGAFGIAATEILSKRQGPGLAFRQYPIGSYSVAMDDEGNCTALTRRFRWTPEQCVAAYGRERLPACIQKLYDDPAQRRSLIELRQHICTRFDRDPRKGDALNKPFASYIIYEAEKELLEESGYDSCPVAVSRWEPAPDSPYGWSPAMLALPEALSSNHLEEMLDVQAETAAYPRALTTGSLRGAVDYAPGGLTVWDPTAGPDGMPREWLTGARYDIGKDRAAEKKRAIEDAFFVPLFNGVSQLRGDATATEVRALVTESRELFHPIFSNLTTEFLGPVLRRSFAILLRQGEFPPPPAEVIVPGASGAFIDDPMVEYTSAMALALEQSHLANLADCLNVLGPITSMDPSAMDFLNTDVIGPEILRAKGLPANFIRSPEEIAQMRQARAQQQQMAMIPNAAKAIKDVGGIQQLQAMAAQGQQGAQPQGPPQ